MATMPQAGLDAPPPLPPDVAATQRPGLAQMTEGQPGQAQEGVIERAMMIEQMVSSLAQMLPGFSSAADQIVQVLRQGVVAAMQETPSASPQGMGMGMGMMG